MLGFVKVLEVGRGTYYKQIEIFSPTFGFVTMLKIKRGTKIY
jgi:hypothetical protein